MDALPQSNKVVHLTTVHHPYDTRIYHKECLSLKKAGYDVSLIVSLEDKQAGQTVITSDGVKLIGTKKRKGRLKRMIFSTWQTYKLAKKEKADYYHFHDPELLWVGWLLKNKTNRVIYDVHEDYYTAIMQKDYLPSALKKLVGAVYNKLEKLFIRKMDICLAEKYYQEHYPQGIKILNYPILNTELLKTNNSASNIENALIYTGNVTEVRGSYLHAQLPSLPSKPDVYFYGKCASEIADEMKSVAGANKDQLFFTGIDQYVERNEIDQAYLSKSWLAGIAIFPPTQHYMRKELTKFFEYMTAGIPIICSNFPVWEAFIQKYKCGIAVDPNNQTEWNQAINYLHENHEARENMIANGRQAVINELNWTLEEKKLLNWYKEIGQ